MIGIGAEASLESLDSKRLFLYPADHLFFYPKGIHNMLRFFALLIFFYITNITGCSHSVDPIHPTFKDPHTYTWTIDTVYYTTDPKYQGQTIIQDILGINDTTIYAVGHDAFGGYGSMWKYTGNRWERVKLFAREGGFITQSFDLSTIKGFSENNIFAMGESKTNITGEFVRTSFALHFDGVQWKEMPMPKGGAIWFGAAFPPSTIYCGGGNGELYKYNGNVWSIDTIVNASHPNIPVVVMPMGVTTNNGAYIQIFEHNDKTGQVYYQVMDYDGKNNKFIDSSVNGQPWGGNSFWQSSTDLIYSSGQFGITKLSAGKWKKFYSDQYIYSSFGSSDEHIFALGQSQVLFFNGSDWNAIYNVPSYFVVGKPMWCSDTQVFISFSDGTRSYILHGK